MLMYLPTRIDDGSPPHAVPVANGLIIAANVLLFFLGIQWTVGPGSGPLSIIGYGFSHAGIGHLMINMWLLLIAGNAVNRRIGDRYYALLYFGTVITLGVFAWFFSGRPLVGSSGAIFAVVAVLAMLIPSAWTYVGYVVVFPLSVLWGWFSRPAHWLYWIIRWDTLRLRTWWLLILVPVLQLMGLLWWWNWTNFGHLFGFVCGIAFVLLLPDRIAKPGYAEYGFNV
jgi:membrane associated rhomboid family serine protease